MAAIDAVLELARELNRLGIVYAIGGSFASSIWGQPRQTNDLDLTLELDGPNAKALADAVRERFYVEDNDIAEALASDQLYRSFQLLHFDEAFKIDCFIANDDEYTKTELSRRIPIQLDETTAVFVVSAEDIVLQKMRWYEMTNRTSDRQWNDLIQVVDMRKGRLDNDYLRRWAGELGVSELLESALSSSPI